MDSNPIRTHFHSLFKKTYGKTKQQHHQATRSTAMGVKGQKIQKLSDSRKRQDLEREVAQYEAWSDNDQS